MLGALIQSIFHPTEIGAMLKVKLGGKVRKFPNVPLAELAKTLNNHDFCYAVLNKVSRSFAVVIQQLPEELKDCVCIFYLVLRGLDSVEDDTTFPMNLKVPLLKCFHEKLEEDGWHINDVGDSADYRVLLANFGKVIAVYKALKPEYQAVIKDITQKMGAGMEESLQFQTSGTGVPDLETYNLYCHYVAGLVGHGLSALFSASGIEDKNLAKELRISNSMGLFLQKTNIIRDYLEDLEQNRTWWPKQIWGEYSSSLDFFRNEPKHPNSVACLNHMVTDALTHLPDCLDYLNMLRDPKVFEFCAIPQVMAIATLSRVYNNINVFKGVVKVRKGLSCKMMLQSTSPARVHQWFRTMALNIKRRVPYQDPNASKTHKLLDQSLRLLTPVSKAPASSKATILSFLMILFGLMYFMGFFSTTTSITTTSSSTETGLSTTTTLDSSCGICSLAVAGGMAYALGHALGLVGNQ